MTQHDLVFHLTDDSLFDEFLAGISRDLLIAPLRKSQDLFKRHFRGFRLNDTTPDLAAIQRAYRIEVRDHVNAKLVNHLCYAWLSSNPAVRDAGLGVLGIEADHGESMAWLNRAHGILQTETHPVVARRIARALAFDCDLNSVLIFVSILSYGFERQQEISEAVRDEYDIASRDPQSQKAYVEGQLRQVAGQLADLEQAGTEAETDNDRQVGLAHSEQDKLAAALSLAIDDRTQEKEAVESIEAQIGKLLEQREAAAARLGQAEQRVEKHQTALDHYRSENDKRHSQRIDRIKSLRARQAEAIKRRQLLEETVAALQAKIDEQAQEREAMQAQSPAAEAAPLLTQAASVSPRQWLTEFFGDVQSGEFSSSCVTLELLRLKRSGVLSDSDVLEPTADVRQAPLEWQQFLASAAVYQTPRWNRASLAKYAWVRHFYGGAGPDVVLDDLAIGGLYHAARVADEQVTTGLLERLFAGFDDTSTEVATDADEEPSSALDGASRLSIGENQAKLATSNPKALHLLYERAGGRRRVLLKRALVNQLPQFGLDERDPAHEVLDIVTSRLASVCAPLSALSKATWRRGSMYQLLQMRPPALKASKAMIGLFSADTDHRLEQFRSVLGVQLTAAARAQTPEGYGSLLQSCHEFLEAELRQPEWISSRYLFPIVVELARCALGADLEARQTLQAELLVELEKSQHPIGAAARRVDVGVKVVNSGTATASDVDLVFVAGGSSAKLCDVTNAELSLQRVPPQNSVSAVLSVDVLLPATALEIDYVASWRDHSEERKVKSGTLKLIAQRVVDWESAAVNPYSLRSITQPDRLFGRHDVLERLKSGVLGVQSFYLTGQKRVGKTSVARVLYQQFATRTSHLSVYVTLGELNNASSVSLMQSLLRTVAQQAEPPHRDDLLRTLAGDAEQLADAGVRQFAHVVDRAPVANRVLCVIDDFDELAERLYKGEEAHSLFLQLRALIDRGNWSFVLVGSERLPEILRHQGERLNQVKRINLDYLTDDASHDALVRAPAQTFLEYSDEAVATVKRFSAGNPYYSTQICMRLYEDLVTRRDHFVGQADVERSVAALCEEEAVSTFQHFWRDGVFAAGPEAERFQQLNAHVLLACAAIAAGSPSGAARGDLLDSAALRVFAVDEVKYRIDELCDRGVLKDASDRLTVRVPLFAKWMQGAGPAAMRASFGERSWESLANPSRRGVPATDVIRVAKDLIYQGGIVSELKVKAWLEQFGAARSQELMFALLKRVRERGYYNSQRVFPILKRLHALILAEMASDGEWAQQVRKRRPTNVFVSYLDKEGKSGASMLYEYRTANGLPSGLTGSLEDAAAFARAAATRSVIVLVDDFIGTGGTFVEGLRRLEELMGKTVADCGHAVFGAVVAGLNHGVHAVKAATDVRCFVGDELTSQDRAFSPDAGIFQSDVDRLEAQALCADIGGTLEPKHPLGYNDCQALVVFEHRCPNNTLPVFYKEGRSYQGHDWLPLFPRV